MWILAICGIQARAAGWVRRDDNFGFSILLQPSNLCFNYALDMFTSFSIFLNSCDSGYTLCLKFLKTHIYRLFGQAAIPYEAFGEILSLPKACV